MLTYIPEVVYSFPGKVYFVRIALSRRDIKMGCVSLLLELKAAEGIIAPAGILLFRYFWATKKIWRKFCGFKEKEYLCKMKASSWWNCLGELEIIKNRKCLGI